MRLVDWVYFVAEHDDHHLAQARGITNSRANDLFQEARSFLRHGTSTVPYVN